MNGYDRTALYKGFSVVSISFCLLLCLAFNTFADAESNIVGYMSTELRKGSTYVEMPIADMEGSSFFTLSIFKDAAVLDDEIYYYTTSYASNNVCFRARFDEVGGTNHFVSAATGAIVDDYLLPAVMTGGKLRVLYKRKRDVTTWFSMSGTVPREIMAAYSVADKSVYASQNMSAFVNFLREGLYEMMDQYAPGGIYNHVLKDEKVLLKSGVQDYFGNVRESLKVQFVVYFATGAKRVEFDAKTGTFTDVELSSTFEFDASVVRGFGYIKDEKLPKTKILPEWMVKEMNNLRKRRFFEDKRLLEVVFRDNSTVTARYVKEDDGLWDMQTDIRIDLEADDVVAFAVPSNLNYATWGIGRFLSEEEVRVLDKRLLAKKRANERLGNKMFSLLKNNFMELLVTVSGGLIVTYVGYLFFTPLPVKSIGKRVRRNRKRKEFVMRMMRSLTRLGKWVGSTQKKEGEK